MEHDLIDRIASLLRESGFRNLAHHKSSVSDTLSADNDGVRVVVHFSEAADAAMATATAAPHSTAPKDLSIFMKATMPGLRGEAGPDALRSLRQGGGGGGGASKRG